MISRQHLGSSALLFLLSLLLIPSSFALTVTGKPPATVVVGKAFSFTPTVSNSVGKRYYRLRGTRPAWLHYAPSTATISGTPTAPGAWLDLVLVISDSQSRVVLPVPLTAKKAATKLAISGTPATSVTAGQRYSFTPTTVASGTAKITYQITNAPKWATFSTATGSLAGTPAAAQTGITSNIVIKATDGTQSASLAPFSITVNAAAASAPTISGSPATSVVAGQAYSFQPTAVSKSGAALTFRIANKPVWANFNTANGALSGTPTAAQVGTSANVIITVSDGKLEASLPAFAISVVAAPVTAPPPVSSIPSTSACSVALRGSHATYDVGPGKTYTELTNVPWLSLQAGDVVNIYYRATPYRTKFALKAQGTAAAPVVINGVTDANCNQPVVSGTNAVYAADRASSGYDNQWSLDDSVIYIWWGNGGWANKPKFITIQNLKLTGGSSGIFAVTVEDLLVQNCEITDVNGWGVFVNTKNDEPNGEETSYRVTIRGNRIYNNGVAGSYLYHNLYIQSYRATYEGNYIGSLRAGAEGSSIKDRSSGTIIRYNTIVAAARAIDLVETEGGRGTVDADPLYHDAQVYGNVIINDDTVPGAGSGALIHWGYDNNPLEARKGTLYFFGNTVVSNIQGDWIALFDQQSSSADVDPHNSIEVQNSIIWHSGSARLAMGKNVGKVTFTGRNWISSGWINGDPWNGNTVTVGGQATLIQGTNPLLDTNRRPTASSPVVGQATGTTKAAVSYEFLSPVGVTPRATAKDLGALEHR
jgi:hypothetical protein